MASAFPVPKHRACRLLLQRTPGATSLSLLGLRVRRCRHYRRESRPSVSQGTPLYASLHRNTISRPRKFVRNISDDVYSGDVYSGAAAAFVFPKPLSAPAVDYVQKLAAIPDPRTLAGSQSCDIPHATEAPDRPEQNLLQDTIDHIDRPDHDASDASANPLRSVLQALRERDVRIFLQRLPVICKLPPKALHEVFSKLPRTTASEMFRCLDPLRVAEECDPNPAAYTPVGMYKMLEMSSTIDEWGVRRLYLRNLRCALVLMDAVKAAGHVLHAEEYIVILRCTGVCTDIKGSQHIWAAFKKLPSVFWQNTEAYNEFSKARFLIDPLYTNFSKIARMASPRTLHLRKIKLHSTTKSQIDALRYKLRQARLRFGLNRDARFTEELMRMIRGTNPALSLYLTCEKHTFEMDEPLLCSLMVALARSGSLRLIGSEILEKFFGITATFPWPPTGQPLPPGHEHFIAGPYRIQPTVRLMRAIVEAFGSNAEIPIVLQLVELLYTEHQIGVPDDVWQDILEWAHIMSSPPASTEWAKAGLNSKIPRRETVQMIFDAMVSHPYNHSPSFEQYNLIIRNLIARRMPHEELTISYMRQGIALYHKQCEEYEQAVFENVEQQRNGIGLSSVMTRFERTRIKKQRMWYHISDWCRLYLRNHWFSWRNPVPPSWIPDFLDEFQEFIRNPIQYQTATGHISFADPTRETFWKEFVGLIRQQSMVKTRRGAFKYARLSQPLYVVHSTRSLANFRHGAFKHPFELLAPHRTSSFQTAAKKRGGKKAAQKPVSTDFD